ncbi:MAG: hypothetical protein J6X86_03190 [Bacteroidales bacterium]|nr:hypothetical protein [Bacteroidales bacterium]
MVVVVIFCLIVVIALFVIGIASVTGKDSGGYGVFIACSLVAVLFVWGLIVLSKDARAQPNVERQWDGTEYVYVDSSRFCYHEKEREGYFTCLVSNPTKDDTCILCNDLWKHHARIQRTQEEIHDAYYPVFPIEYD